MIVIVVVVVIVIVVVVVMVWFGHVIRRGMVATGRCKGMLPKIYKANVTMM